MPEVVTRRDFAALPRVESSEPPFETASFHPKMKCVWTQPYAPNAPGRGFALLQFG